MERVVRQSIYWDNIAGHYDHIYNYDNSKVLKMLNHRADLLIQATGMNAMDNILEIGCGTGLLTAIIHDKVGESRFHAIDCSNQMIAESKLRWNNDYRLWGVGFQQMDAHNLQFEDNRYDVVFGNYVLMYLDLPIALKEIRRVLEYGGRVGFIELNALYPPSFVLTRTPFKYLFGKSKEAASFFPQEIKAQIEQAGFINVKVQMVRGSLLISGTKG